MSDLEAEKYEVQVQLLGLLADIQTRHRKQYRCEMDDKGQNELLDVAMAHKGPVLLSGYNNDLYNDRLQGWYREETISYSQTCVKKQEVLWMNFEPGGQMSLF